MATARTDIYLPELLDLTQCSFEPVERQEFSRSADGVTRGKDLGEALWRLSFVTRSMLSSDALAYEARLRSLRGVIGRFFAGDPRRCYPRAHRTGAFNDTGTIHTLGGDNKSLRIDSLDPGLALSVGDYLAFPYGATPSYALHQVVEPAVADGSGLTPLFEVYPHIRPGVAVSAAVTLKLPQALFALEPGSVRRNHAGGPRWTVGFSAMQVIE